MRRVYQEEKNDCLRCCIASLLEMDIGLVPNFYQGCKSGVPVPSVIQEGMYAWFKEIGLYIIEVPMMADSVEEMMSCLKKLHPGLRVILSGQSPRGLDHAVIVKDGAVVFDPSRNGGGLTGPCSTGLFYASYIGKLV